MSSTYPEGVRVLASVEPLYEVQMPTLPPASYFVLDGADASSRYTADDVRAMLAAAVAAAVPPGWKLVPVTASDDMLRAGLVECEPLGELVNWREGFGRVDMLRTYCAMLAAAPEVPR